MKICDNSFVRNATPEEEMRIQGEQEQADLEYWQNVSYDDAVNTEIRKRYSETQEFSILRQKDEKPAEYKAYFDYCEQCKLFVKSKMKKTI